ncbi:MAG: hypothetical protein ABI548_18350 [Polyangiaceae bacterium]
MIGRYAPVLLLALANFACSKDPVLGADVDWSAATATSSAPSASTPSPPVLSRPPLTQQVVAGFPACGVDPPPRPRQYVPCEGVGDGVCWRRNTERLRTYFDEQDVATQLRPLLAACLRPSLLPSSVVWATIGILPSGRICALSFVSSMTLLPPSLACAARRLHAYRATVADKRSALTFAVVVPLGAPVVLRSTP